MSALPVLDRCPTLGAVDAALEAEAKQQPPRGYLGMSAIGRDCGRALWYAFRLTEATNAINAQLLRRFQSGHLGEELMAKRLRMVKSIQLWTHTDSGEQFGYSDHGGHFSGHLDGVIKGVLQAPRTPHVWEHKDSSDKVFADLRRCVEKAGEKNALQAWNPTYYAQAQVYMHYADLDRHYLTVSTPGGRDYTAVRTEYDREAAQHYIRRAKQIIESVGPPERISNDPASSQCKPYGRMCEFHAVCHGKRIPTPHCRNCAHSTPVTTGSGAVWRCERRKKTLTLQEQLAGCELHLVLPPLIQYAELEQGQDAEDQLDYVMLDGTGRKFRNGAKVGFKSSELAAVESPELLFDKFVETVREQMDGRIVPFDLPPTDPATKALIDMSDDVPF